MKNLIILVIALIGVGINASAQEKSNKELRGDKHYFVYSFDKAIDSYTQVKQLTTEGQRKLAESYNNLNQNIESERAYSKLLSLSDGVLPEDHYNYAVLLKINGKYKESHKSMNKFVFLKPNDLRAKDYILNKSEFVSLSKDNGKYKIINQNVNTDAEDLAPCYYKDKVVFSSSRAKSKMMVRNSNWTGNPYYDLYVSEIEEGQLKDPKIFDKGLNSKMHDGPASFSKDGNYMAFTSNKGGLNKKDKIVELGIFFSNYDDGKWSDPEDFFLNKNEYSVGHPCLSNDGKTMYFTSDLPGGFGGADIYRATKGKDGKWGKVENLGSTVNTEGDEMFPFFEKNDNTLLFSSNGRFGLGGLDVFTCKLEESGAGRAFNVGAPLNTQFDEYGVVVNDNMTKGYFSSNRNGGSGSGDIYAFDLLRIKKESEIKGIAKDNYENLIPGTFITLMDNKNLILQTLTTNDDASFSFLVEPNKYYKLSGTKEKYIDGKNTANTFSEDTIVLVDITLLKEDATEKGTDLAKVLNLKTETIYFDFGKSNLRPAAVIDLDKVVKIMNENPNMIVKLNAHTDCRGTESFNQKLSDRRAKVPVWYIQQRITNSGRISGNGYGETDLVNKCLCEDEVVSECSEGSHQNNRRTEFIIVSNDKVDALNKPTSQK